MERKKVDVIFIGSGPGGYTGAIRAAQLGKKVALIEKDDVGGVCLNRGCIPTKTFAELANLYLDIKKGSAFGLKGDIREVDWAEFAKHQSSVISSLRNGLASIFRSRGIDVIKGPASILNARTVQVDADKSFMVEGARIVLATGSSPRRLPLFAVEEGIYTSDDIFTIADLPRDIVIAGGGAIGCEFATFFAALGTRVVLVEKEKRILPAEDGEMADYYRNILAGKGISVLTETEISGYEKVRGVFTVTLSGDKKLKADAILQAAGRRPNTNMPGMENLGIAVSGEGIKTDRRGRTSREEIYAVGDVTGGPFLAHRASADALTAVGDICGVSPKRKSPVPYCLYSIPEFARVGLTEEDAVRTGHEVTVGKYPYGALGRSFLRKDRDGLFKVVGDKKSGKLLGAHIVGRYASEIITSAAAALWAGMTCADLSWITHPHPTICEGLQEACRDVAGQAVNINRAREK